MKYKVYSIYDVQAEIFQRPIFAVAEGEALRAFIDIAGSAEHAISKHPADYSLFYVGTWNDSNGEMIDDVSKCVLTGIEAYQQGRQINLDIGESANA